MNKNKIIIGGILFASAISVTYFLQHRGGLSINKSLNDRLTFTVKKTDGTSEVYEASFPQKKGGIVYFKNNEKLTNLGDNQYYFENKSISKSFLLKRIPQPISKIIIKSINKI